MLSRLLYSAALAAAVLTSSANAQLSESWRTCTGKSDVDWDQQIKSCTAIIESGQETQPNLAKAYNSRGITWTEKREYQRAIADHTEAIRLDPNNADAFVRRGVAWHRFGEIANAIADYTEAIRLDPDRADAYYHRASAWRMSRDIDRVIADYTEVIRIDPTFAPAYYFRASTWHTKGDLDRASADYTETIRLNPKYLGAYSGRGRVWIDKGEVDRAIADDTEAIRLDPNSSAHHAARGFAHFYAGDFPASAADLQRAIELGRGTLNDTMFRYIARTRIGEDATPDLAAYHSRFGRPPVLELYLGRARPEAVLNERTGLLNRCQAEFYVGEWHLIRGRRDEARTYLQSVADKCKYAAPSSHVAPYHPAAVAELKRMGR